MRTAQRLLVPRVAWWRLLEASRGQRIQWWVEQQAITAYLRCNQLMRLLMRWNIMPVDVRYLAEKK